MIILRSLIKICAVLGCRKNEQDNQQNRAFVQEDAVNSSGYLCAGDGKCLNSNVNQPSGNILCSINFMLKEDAVQRCNFENRRTNLCEGIIQYSTKNGTRYELVKTAIDGCRQTDKFSLLKQNSNNFRFIRISEMKQKRSRRSTPTISSSDIIFEHGEKPFRRTMNFFQEENMTVYEVDAHLEYTKNVIYRLHAFNTMVVVTPDTCLFVDDSEKMKSQLESENLFFITTANTQEIQKTVSVVPAQISLDPYPTILRDHCANKTILEEEYKLQDQFEDSTFRVSFEDLQNDQKLFHNGRSRRHTEIEVFAENIIKLII